jgi:hypothetical protein
MDGLAYFTTVLSYERKRFIKSTKAIYSCKMAQTAFQAFDKTENTLAYFPKSSVTKKKKVYKTDTRSPTIMVCLLPRVFMRRARKPVCAMTERMPMAAMNMATASFEKSMTSRR